MTRTTTNGIRKRGSFHKRMRSRRESEIIRVAASVLLEKGCLQFRVEDVANACGVAKGTCYQHFESQDDLIAAAVRYLDGALGARLRSPASRLAERQNVLEWALLQAVDAQVAALSQRTQPAEPGALAGNAWPCCLGVVPCPHGGAAESGKALLRWTTERRSPTRVRPSLHLELLLAVVPTYYLRLDHNGKVPNPRAIRSAARQLFKLLFSQEKRHARPSRQTRG